VRLQRDNSDVLISPVIIQKVPAQRLKDFQSPNHAVWQGALRGDL
jgi:hypothetical protein